MALGLTQPLRNYYQEYFLGGDKGGRCVGLTIFMYLNLLEPSRPAHELLFKEINCDATILKTETVSTTETPVELKINTASYTRRQ